MTDATFLYPKADPYPVPTLDMQESRTRTLDPRVSLATTMHALPGAYALLVGSGVSTGAGILTGWRIVEELIRRAATANDPDASLENLDPDAWWQEHGDGEPLGYSALLGKLASTPAARRAILAAFFEPTEEDRASGLKVPGPAHRAIAQLVVRGTTRVILTTNFDRLIEQALESEGVLPQVISSPAAVAGMEPLAHARCTLLKLHGDYASAHQLNTVEELSGYVSETGELLDRVLDEYGLVVSGWSGEWDHALTHALERTAARRYPLYWATHDQLSQAAKHLVAQHRAHVIPNATADHFFPDLVARLEALDALSDPPLSAAMAIARLKRALPDPTRHLEVRDLLEGQVFRIRDALAERPSMPPANDPQSLQEAHEQLRRDSELLLQLLATGVYLDRDRQHTALWVEMIEQVMRARHTPTGSFQEWWDNLQHYPALLALRTGCMAATAARRDDVLIRLLREPTWRERFGTQRTLASFDALHEYRVLDHEIINAFPRWQGSRWLYPRSHLLRDTLRPIFLPIVGDQDSYEQLCGRTEYRIALALARFGDDRSLYRSVPGEFIGDGGWNWEGQLVWEVDFRANGDHAAWGWTSGPEGEPTQLDEALSELRDDLNRSRRFG